MSTANSTWHTTAETSLGTLTLVRDDTGLRGLYFPQHWHLPNPSPFGPGRDEGFDEALAQLTEYLAGARRAFQLPLAPSGPDRQLRVWALIQQIGYGRTTT